MLPGYFKEQGKFRGNTVFMLKYILHIGYGKTGTTAVQQALAVNRSRLLEHGVLYPDVWHKGVPLNAPDHNSLGRSLAGRTGWWGLQAEDYFQQFETQAERAKTHTCILSAETFLGAVEPWQYETPDDYFLAAKVLVERLARILAGRDVRIVVYLRRQDLWMESVVNQAVKTARLLPPPLCDFSVDQIVTAFEPRVHYDRVLGAWAEQFGGGNMIVVPFESGSLKEGDVVCDFAARAGIRDIIDLDRADRRDDVNVSLGRHLIEIKRYLNRSPRSKSSERAIIAFLNEIEREERGKRPDPGSFLGFDRRHALMKRMAEVNRNVVEAFPSLGDGPLFETSWNESGNVGGGVSEAPLDPDYLTYLWLRMAQKRHSLRGRALVWRHWIAEMLRRHAPVLHGPARLVLRLAKGGRGA